MKKTATNFITLIVLSLIFCAQNISAKSGDIYHIVLGSYQTLDSARVASQTFGRTYKNVEICRENKIGRYRVMYNPEAENADEAHNALNQVKNICPDAWLLVYHGYEVYAAGTFNIRNDANGTVVKRFVNAGAIDDPDDTGYSFSVIESKGEWLKIDKSTFSELRDITDECWIHNSVTHTGLIKPGAFEITERAYAKPDGKSSVVGDIFPDRILEIRGKWVKVEGRKGKMSREYKMLMPTSVKIKGWIYDPNLGDDRFSA